MRNEEDKYRKKDGRKASEKEKDSDFLDEEVLDEDLVSPDEVETDDHGQIVDSRHPENQEWQAREDENRDNMTP